MTTIIRSILALLIALPLLATPARAGGTFNVETRLGAWTDTGRSNRVVPWKMYLPVNAPGRRPVVIHSHGLGGNRDVAPFLLEYLAAHGYVAIAVQHAGSDTPAVRNRLEASGAGRTGRLAAELTSLATPAAAIDRFRDISFAIDELERVADADLAGRIDIGRIGVSGHSFGAITSLAIAGQGIGERGLSFADDRVRAVIAYSPSKPRRGDPAAAFATIRIPTFHMTGTADTSPIESDVSPQDRTVPYRSITSADRFLVVFTGGTHGIFSGRGLRGTPEPGDEKFHPLISRASLAFWDAYLRDDRAGRDYLTGGAFARDLGALGTFEFRVQ